MRRNQIFLFNSLAGMLAALPILTGCIRTISTPLSDKRTTTVPAASSTAVVSPSPLPKDSNLPASTPYPQAEQLNPVTMPPTTTAISIPSQNNEQTPAPISTPLPTMAIEGLADHLESAFLVQELQATNGHTLLKITGWDYGFRSSRYCEYGPYRWLDENHLLLFSNAGEEEGMGIYEWTWPVVISLDGHTWLPPVDGRNDHCRSIEWSQALQALINSKDGDLLISNLDGKLLRRIAGKGDSRIVISPSGGKILTANTWIDLANGNEFEYNPDINFAGPFYPAWTEDEERIFNCCYAYLDASNREARQFELGGLKQAGRGLYPGFDGIDSRWVLSDTHSMTLWDFDRGDQWGIVPLFVPEAQAYLDVRDLVGIPTDQPCVLSSISPDGNLIWIQCGKQDDYLIDLRSYEKNWFTEEQIFGWSADNQFALIGKISNSDQHIGRFELFFIPERRRVALSEPSTLVPVWSPQGHQLAYLNADGQTLVQVDAEDTSSQSISLPDIFRQVIWSPKADRLALVAQDGSIWLVDPIHPTKPEQIGPPLPGVRDVRWSPDGLSLSLISRVDLFIVK